MDMVKEDFVAARVHAAITPGEALRIIRELQELTQSQLAAMSGIAQANISALETGEQQMGRDRALVLAKALCVHPAVLLFPDFDVTELTKVA